MTFVRLFLCLLGFGRYSSRSLRVYVYIFIVLFLVSGRKRNGVRPSHYCRSSGSVARKALQALENLKLIEKAAENRGRKLTAQGRRDVDRIAAQIKTESKRKLLQLKVQQAGITVQ